MGKTKILSREKISQEDELPNDVPIRHPNRNVDKRNDASRDNIYKGKLQSDESDKNRNEALAETLTDKVPIELPSLISKEILAQLKEFTSERCITIYLPTHASGMEVNEGHDAIRFKNALQQAHQQLTHLGHNEDAIKQWLKPGYDMLHDDAFWTRQSKGLAVFISDGYCRYLHMQQEPAENVYINKSFALAPLISLLTNPEYFYLLVISKQQAKLFRADDYGMTEVKISNMPDGVDGTKRMLDKSASTFRASGAASNGGANYHGIGGGNPDDKQNIAVYLEAVDDRLWEALLNKEYAPLLLAGVEYLIPIYRSVSDYKHVWTDALTGSHEHEDIATLYPKARAIMQPYFEQRLSNALERYGNQSATPQTSTNLAEIIPAAHYGRISHLFVVKGEQVWGTFDELTNELTVQGESTGDNEDLFDKAVTNTLLTGGEVFIVDSDKMPAASTMAAIMRY
ncbi:MAG: hypothetical protein J7621_18860 [Niastella sp.]|nr:hypothetical protein [Niastella sp.]